MTVLYSQIYFNVEIHTVVTPRINKTISKPWTASKGGVRGERRGLLVTSHPLHTNSVSFQQYKTVGSYWLERSMPAREFVVGKTTLSEFP